MAQSLNVLVVEDVEDDVLLLRRALQKGGYEVTLAVVERAETMRAALLSQAWDVIVSDHSMPHFSAPEALTLAREICPETPFIILSGEIDLNLAVSLMRGGAKDYVQKGELARLAPVIERELREVELREERRKIDAALSQSTQRLREIMENSLDVAYQRDLHTNAYDYFSPVVLQIAGFTPQEMLDMPFEEVVQRIHPDDLAELKLITQEAVSAPDSTTRQVEYRFRHKDGHHFWILDKFSVIRDAFGQPLRLIGSISDISERKLVEEELRRSKRQFDTLAANIPAGIFTLRSTPLGLSAFEYVSPKIAEIFDTPAERFLEDPTAGFEPVHPDDFQAFVQLNLEHFQNPKPFDWEGRVIIHGDIKWIHIRSMPEPLEGGEVRWHGIAEEITARKQVEKQLLESEEKFNKIFQAAPVWIAITDLETGIYQDINEEATRGTGYSREEALGHTAAEIGLIRPEDRARLVQSLQETGHFSGLEMNFHAKNGQILHGLINGEKILIGGRPCLLTATVDISARKVNEDQIRLLNSELEKRVAERTAELRAANQELESFAYSISHDLRTPLRALNGFSEVLLEDYSAKLDETGRGYLGRIQSAALRMGQLIEDLLKLSRITRLDFKRQPVDLSQLAEQIAAELRVQAPQRAVAFEIAPGLAAMGDENFLKIALENLLNNAYKFTSRREQAVIQVGSQEQDGGLVFFVRDNGAGFDMDYAQRLFGPFQRLHSERDFPGSGIGLSIVQRIIHRHGGRVWAEAAPEHGATFFFTLGS